MAAASGSVRLHTGQLMPVVGMGTSMSNGEAMKAAIDVGYRHIDTAQFYDNEDQFGDAMEEKIKEGKIKREEIFITTKLCPAAMAPENVRSETLLSLKRMKTEYLDLYLIHFPVSVSGEGMKQNPPDKIPRYRNGALKTTFIDPLDTWREMEKLVDEGLVKAIGLSNFNVQQMTRMYEQARIKPANLQIEIHAWFPQYELVEFCQKRGIAVSAYAPLGSPGKFPASRIGPATVPLLEEPVLKEIADKHKKTPAQVLLRNLIQRGIVVLPKSVTPERMKSNLQIMDFELSEDEMHIIKGLNKELRLFTFKIIGKQNFSHPFWPWPEMKDLCQEGPAASDEAA